MSAKGFGDWSTASSQREAMTEGGIRIECGEFTVDNSAAKTTACDTHLTTLFCGFALSGVDVTHAQYGTPVSICKGQFIDWTLTDATMSRLHYIAFGI